MSDAAAAIRVWAPLASTVEIEAGRVGSVPSRYAMTPESGGWWAWAGSGDDVDAVAGPGTHAGPDGVGLSPATDDLDYAFVLDGPEPALPDPRSAYQPEGVNGPSRWYAAGFDGSQRARTDGWRGPRAGEGVLGAVFYELHVGTFTPEGTLAAATEHLAYLADLGVDVVELMPVAGFPGRWNWGYDGVDLWAVTAAYGGPSALVDFVAAAHAHGLGVCLDVVYNHLGPSGNYLARFGPYFTDAHLTPWGPAVNFDAEGSHEVRRFVIDAALRWFRDVGVDALRLDAVHELRDDSRRHILAQLSDEVASLATELGRPLALVAESDLNDARMVAPTVDGGLGMTAQWDDDVHHALHVALTGETSGYYADFADPDALAKVLTRGFFHDGTWSSFRGRDWGRPIELAGFDGHRLLAYLQTHDQVGNRAVGDRISQSITAGQQAIGAALYLTSAFTPMIFMGEEWRASTPFQFFTDFEEPELAAAVSTGRREEFASHGWKLEDVPDPQDPATRERSVLRWSERTEGEHRRMHDWYAALIALRRASPDLASGDLVGVGVSHDTAEGWLVMRRGAFATVCNLSPDPARVPVGGEADAAYGIELSWSGEATVTGGGGHRDTVALAGHDVAVLRRR